MAKLGIVSQVLFDGVKIRPLWVHLHAGVWSVTKSQDAHAIIKERREALVRALGSAGQARTWNLMIDLIAQTGRFPATATGFTNFQVTGEQRYWAHVAIDRYTGQVMSLQLEPVSDKVHALLLLTCRCVFDFGDFPPDGGSNAINTAGAPLGF